MRTIGSIFALLLVAAILPAAAGGGALDGRTFAGEIGEQGKTRGDADNFVFADGTFRSTACDAYGFGAAAYTARRQDGATVFEATTTSAKEGTMAWKGTVSGDAVQGTVSWTKGGKTTQMWFKGRLKKG